MKLKKIASLMLAGVMAVSMLAGCSTNGKTEDKTEEPVVDTSVASVLNDAQEDNDVKINFTYSSSLESAIKKTLEVTGAEDDDAVEPYLVKVLGAEDVYISDFYGYKGQSGTNQVGKQTAVVLYRGDAGKTDAGVAEDLYDVMSAKLANLSKEWTNNNVKWSFSYTGEVASVKVVEDNQTYTYMAAVLTCNTTKALAD